MQPKTNRKKPDRIILFEIGLIVALLFVNYMLNFQYRIELPKPKVSFIDPFDDTAYQIGAIIEPQLEQKKEPRKKEIVEASSFDVRAIIKQVDQLFEINDQKIAPPTLPLPGTIAPIQIPSVMQPSKDVVNFADVMPQFPGGDEALNRFIRDHFDIPAIIIDNEYKVALVVEFIIDENGKVTDFKILKCSSPGMGLEEAAAATYRAMPIWTPGEHRGGRAKVRLRQPINVLIN